MTLTAASGTTILPRIAALIRAEPRATRDPGERRMDLERLTVPLADARDPFGVLRMCRRVDGGLDPLPFILAHAIDDDLLDSRDREPDPLADVAVGQKLAPQLKDELVALFSRRLRHAGT